MKKENNFFKDLAFWILILSGIAFVITVLLFLQKTGLSSKIDTNILDDFGSFVGGLFGSLLTFVSTLFLIYSINKQQEEIDNLKERENENEFYNQLIKFLDLYREQSKSYILKNGTYTVSNLNNQFRFYLGHFATRYSYLQRGEITQEAYRLDDLSNKIEDEATLKVLYEMSTKLIFIFKYIDNSKYGTKYYETIKFFLLKEEFRILYFYCLLTLVEYKMDSDVKNEEFIYNFYKKIQIQEFLEDDFLNSIMADRFLIYKG